jgi:hypothetical protein
MKQALNINFQQGLDLKTDPLQVQVGKFLSLQNTVFDKIGRMTKRNGFGELPALPNDSEYCTTFSGNLTAIGSELDAYVAGSKSWVTKAKYTPLSLDVLTLIRSSTNQSQCDSVVSSNGIVCTVFTDNVPVSGTVTPFIKYAIADSNTGQNIVPPQVIPTGSGTPTGSARVFILQNYFIIIFTNLIGGTSHLQFIAIAINNPIVITTNADIASGYTPASTVSWDAYSSANGNIYVAYDTLAGGQQVQVTSINSSLAVATPLSLVGSIATMMSVTADDTVTNPPIYVSFYDVASHTGYTAVVSAQLAIITAPVQIINGITVANITSSAQGANNSASSVNVLYEVVNAYGYDSTLPDNFVDYINVAQGGTVGAVVPVLREVGLGSKSFLYNGTQYCLFSYESPYQPSYFLSDVSGNIISRFAYENGGGYLPLGLPSVSLNGAEASVSYLFKDLVQAVNKDTNVPPGTQVNGIYSQLGVNMVTFDFDAEVNSIELGKNLNITGGFVWAYDGYALTEQGFFLYPDFVEPTASATGGGLTPQEYFYQVTYEWTDNQGNAFKSAPSIPVSVVVPSTGTPVTFHSVFSSGVVTITASSVTGLFVGQVLTGAHLQANTVIEAINGTILTLSLPTSGASAGSPGDLLTTIDIGAVNINIPTLRLTYKTQNPAKIVIYRWSTAQEEYFQVTSIENPILNDLSVDYITYTDTLNDLAILGNNLIYTTGGVVEDIGPPATSLMTVFDTRLWLVDSEDPNLCWYSKTLVENTPVEMSDLLTFFISPTIGAQGSPGPITMISNMDDKLILSLGGTSMYYVNGTGPDSTGANGSYSEPIFITSTVGCANERSIVFIPQGLMFQSNKGIWLLQRDLGTSYIGAPVEDFNDALVTAAVNVPGTNQVRFTLSDGVTLMYDYYVEQWGVFIGIPAVSSTIYEGLHTFINSNGEVYQETVGEYLDGSEPVLMQFTTSWLNLAGIRGYERFYWFNFLGEYYSPHSLLTTIAYDYSANPSQSDNVFPQNSPNIYGSDPIYGGSSPYGGAPALIANRVHAKRQLCKSFQISVQEVYDPRFGNMYGAGLTLSGISAIVAIEKGWAPTPGAQSSG